ncbi:protein GPR107-like [Liolophura sinensis]|uniref:protein GPR107-like n=1 Tax=Liolophura sinensis TaxID=3198878 RepID=UPI003158C16A
MFIHICFFSLFLSVNCRIHNLVLENDGRDQITLSTFGFLRHGTLKVNVSLFSYNVLRPRQTGEESQLKTNGKFAFTLSKTDNTGANEYLTKLQRSCVLDPNNLFDTEDVKKNTINVVLITLHLDSRPPVLRINRVGEDLKKLELFPLEDSETQVQKRSLPEFESHRKRRDAVTSNSAEINSTSDTKHNGTNSPDTEHPTGVSGGNLKANGKDEGGEERRHGAGERGSFKPPASVHLMSQLPVQILEKLEGNQSSFTFQFQMSVNNESEEGLYNLYFHNCLGAADSPIDSFDSEVSLTIQIIEKNKGNYLSAGEMPLPSLYFVLCCVFFGMGGLWLAVLRKARDDVYKIHFLMLTVVYLKCLSLLFHAIHYHFIEENGTQEEAWAVLYYIAYLMKVTLLFLTILLIGAGWAFVKHLLSEKEKKLFIIFIPLQILANVAFIIVEESEEGTSVYTTWKEIFILVDLLCCGAILFPVVWSIRHLQEASHTDGKAAINLSKLKLFRHFYMLVVCYIYFTRIIVYLLQITVPFKYSWFDELFKQVAVVIFFVVTGMKFRPASDNPYLQVPTESDDEIEMEEVLTKSGALQNVTKVNRGDSSERDTSTTSKRESSHEYD